MVASGHDVPVVMAAPRQLTATGGVPCGLRRGKELGWPPIGEENDMGGRFTGEGRVVVPLGDFR
jgi:hypothetical protein